MVGKYSIIAASATAIVMLAVFLWLPIIAYDEPAHDFSEDETSIIFVGDTMLGRRVETLMTTYGPDYPFEKIAAFLDHHPNVGNLEGPIVATSSHVQTKDMSFQFSFRPSTVSMLAKYGFFFLSLANNHSTDRGEAGWMNTEQLLEAQYINSFGHPVRVDPDTSVAHLKLGGVSIALVGLNTTFSTFNEQSAEKIVRDLENPFVITIAYLHWGNEYELNSDTFQQNLAHKLIEAGADLVIGSHPHVVQEIEEYNGKFIFYSLGNFIFDQYFSKDVEQGLAVKAFINPIRTSGSETDPTSNGASLDTVYISKIELYPIQSYQSQPALMEEPAKSDFLENLAERSDPRVYNEIVQGTIVTPIH